MEGQTYTMLSRINKTGLLGPKTYISLCYFVLTINGYQIDSPLDTDIDLKMDSQGIQSRIVERRHSFEDSVKTIHHENSSKSKLDRIIQMLFLTISGMLQGFAMKTKLM